ncbi:MAG: hypothetical protein AAGF04_03520 [Chlamydiota bacterium]
MTLSISPQITRFCKEGSIELENLTDLSLEERTSALGKLIDPDVRYHPSATITMKQGIHLIQDLDKERSNMTACIMVSHKVGKVTRGFLIVWIKEDSPRVIRVRAFNLAADASLKGLVLKLRMLFSPMCFGARRPSRNLFLQVAHRGSPIVTLLCEWVYHADQKVSPIIKLPHARFFPDYGRRNAIFLNQRGELFFPFHRYLHCLPLYSAESERLYLSYTYSHKVIDYSLRSVYCQRIFVHGERKGNTTDFNQLPDKGGDRKVR